VTFRRRRPRAAGFIPGTYPPPSLSAFTIDQFVMAITAGGGTRAGRCLSRSSVIPRTRSAACFKNVGLVIGRAKFNVFAVRAEELIEDRPEMITVLKACRPAISSARNPAAGTKARKFGRTCGRIKPGDPLR
jgi:hypothetical protein